MFRRRRAHLFMRFYGTGLEHEVRAVPRVCMRLRREGCTNQSADHTYSQRMHCPRATYSSLPSPSHTLHLDFKVVANDRWKRLTTSWVSVPEFPEAEEHYSRTQQDES
jgi:hypothetical protein